MRYKRHHELLLLLLLMQSSATLNRNIDFYKATSRGGTLFEIEKRRKHDECVYVPALSMEEASFVYQTPDYIWCTRWEEQKETRWRGEQGPKQARHTAVLLDTLPLSLSTGTATPFLPREEVRRHQRQDRERDSSPDDHKLCSVQA